MTEMLTDGTSETAFQPPTRTDNTTEVQDRDPLSRSALNVAERVCAALEARYGQGGVVGCGGQLWCYCDDLHIDVDWQGIPSLRGFWRVLSHIELADICDAETGGGGADFDGVEELVYRVHQDESCFDHPARGVPFPGGFMVRDPVNGRAELIPHSPDHRARFCLPFDFSEFDDVERFIERVAVTLPPGGMLDGFRAVLESNLGPEG